jgi:menaquinone-dependent protoporphyrinogen IX oxidase
LGSAIHHGLWLREMTAFVQRYRDTLNHKSVYVWLTCIRVLEEDGYDHVLTHYFRPELMRNIPVKGVTAFAGRLDLKEIDWSQRWTLGLQYDGAKTPENLRGDYRDWKAIRAWVQQISTDFAV